MSGSAIAMMLIGMVIIWGGLGVSVAIAVKKGRDSK
ncbi:methionine/alanine import family NSS transporter small subunit [Bacillus sp. JJ1609]